MISFFKVLPKFIKTAFLSILRHMAMSLSASSAVTITLVLFSAFLIIAGNVSLFTNSIEDDLRIHVVAKKNITSDQQINDVKKQLEDIQGVKSVTISTKKNELEMMIKEKGKEFAMYRGKDNPLSNAYFVTVRDANQIASITAQIKKMPSITDAVYGGNSVSKMISILNTIRSGGLIFVALLTLLAIFLISNTIKMTIYARNIEISIMRNVGAANWYIKVPFMIEGMIIGFVGAIIPCLITFLGYYYMYHMLHGQIVTSMFTLQPVMPFALQICGILVGSGMLVGLVGSFFSTTKYLRWRR